MAATAVDSVRSTVDLSSLDYLSYTPSFVLAEGPGAQVDYAKVEETRDTPPPQEDRTMD